MTPAGTSDVEALVSEEEVSHPQRTQWNKVIGSVFGVILVTACVTLLVIQIPPAGDAAAAEESVKPDSIIQLDSQGGVHGTCMVERFYLKMWKPNHYHYCWNDKVSCATTKGATGSPPEAFQKVMGGGKDDRAACSQLKGKEAPFATEKKKDPKAFKSNYKAFDF
eukprot:TRINITY_DN8492_c1_g1_i1.p1 TRINITY_DN8492_c1_g1~~TRINITY_DN8492_c1_g1_i1.p1  ORF type:complete len:165 (+),score=41.05 TRINITY_DN8492_c1_g1_i1:166-660(+)